MHKNASARLPECISVRQIRTIRANYNAKFTQRTRRFFQRTVRWTRNASEILHKSTLDYTRRKKKQTNVWKNPCLWLRWRIVHLIWSAYHSFCRPANSSDVTLCGARRNICRFPFIFHIHEKLICDPACRSNDAISTLYWKHARHGIREYRFNLEEMSELLWKSICVRYIEAVSFHIRSYREESWNYAKYRRPN